ncbi:hypothetical protein [Kurthia sp. Dielmo]|uniref:hypothetical protein n=1 Tax=Kurthia sp. Dielmo TaxID=1033738 RepID=UPI001120EABB|nr:hypothetical protein [Kurthia sp. Dielmo]
MKKITLIVVIMVMIGGAVYWNYATGIPSLSVRADNKIVEVTQGTYCWSSLISSECVDKIAPTQMVKEGIITPTVVKPGAVLSYQFSKKPVGDSESILFEDEAGHSIDVKRENQTFKAPIKKGLYMYTISARWDKGDVSYAIAIDVK